MAKEFTVRPLLPLTPTYDRPFEFPEFSREGHSPDILNRLTRYLRECPCVIPWMGPTYDEIGAKFKCVDGSAIHSDGVYYWRLDMADYLEHYPYQIDPDALESFISRDWQLPDFGDNSMETRAIRRAFAFYRGKPFPVGGVVSVRMTEEG